MGFRSDGRRLVSLNGDLDWRAGEALVYGETGRSRPEADLVELGIAVIRRVGDRGESRLAELLAKSRIQIEPITEAHAALALEAFRVYGKGRHKAKLNFGDTFSYALAKATGEPLLFKGNDFTQTDITPAV